MGGKVVSHRAVHVGACFVRRTEHLEHDSMSAPIAAGAGPRIG